MSNLPSRKIDAALRKKGFRRSDSGDRVYRLWAGDRLSGITTLMSHTSNMDVGDSLLAQMAAQMKLRKRELLAFVECTLSYEDYLRLLEERGWL